VQHCLLTEDLQVKSILFLGNNHLLRLALICFDIDSEKNCEIFDGATNTKASSTAWNHIQGGLGHYKGRPVSVGGQLSNKAEMLTEEGWIDLPDHPAVL